MNASSQELRIEAATAIKLLEAGQVSSLLDTRSEESIEKSGEMLRGAKQIEVSELESNVTSVPDEGTVLTYCT